ncbi:MAG: AbrB/MazE/SpoVT family DNA-binding domain-containing protein [Candidatus Bathyarchaeia archaeon]
MVYISLVIIVKTWMAMAERFIDIVTAYKSGGRNSLIVTIPRRLVVEANIEKGQKFLVKVDRKGRLIYEPLNPQEGPITSKGLSEGE